MPPRVGTFEHHMKAVESDFWNNRFGEYGEWKKDWYNKYQKKGYFDTLTGFRIRGIMGKNDVINYPVQGAAFHCLLWSLTELQLRQLKKHKMQTKIVGQIHDSIVADVPIEEVADYIALARDVMCERVRKWAPWLIVPLDIEAEVTPEGGTWADKKEVGFDGTTFSYKDAKGNSKSTDNIEALLRGIAA